MNTRLLQTACGLYIANTAKQHRKSVCFGRRKNGLPTANNGVRIQKSSVYTAKILLDFFSILLGGTTMKTVILGGTGFIGFRLARFLAARCDEVVILR